MSGFLPIYIDNSVTYWPYRKSALLCICFLSIVISFCIVSISILFWHSDEYVAILAFLGIVMLCVLGIWEVIKYYHTTVVVDQEGISFDTYHGHSSKQAQVILWTEVIEVKCQRDSWYGLSDYIVSYKKTEHTEEQSYDFAVLRLPLRDIDRSKIDSLIPCYVTLKR